MPEVPPQQQPDDPVVSRSMGLLVLVSMVLLLVTVAWSLWDEFYGLRPWRGYQTEFRGAFSTFVEKQIGDRRSAEQALQATPDYQRLNAAVQAAANAALPEDRQSQAEVDLLDRQRAAMTPAFQDARGRVGSLTYQLEQIPESDTSGREAALKRVNDAKAITYDVEWPTAQGVEQRQFNYDQLNSTFTDLMARKATLVAQRGQNDLATKNAQAAARRIREGALARTWRERSHRFAEQCARHEHYPAPGERESSRRADQLARRRGTGGPLPVLSRGHGPSDRAHRHDRDQGRPGDGWQQQCALQQLTPTRSC